MWKRLTFNNDYTLFKRLIFNTALNTTLQRKNSAIIVDTTWNTIFKIKTFNNDYTLFKHLIVDVTVNTIFKEKDSITNNNYTYI